MCQKENDDNNITKIWEEYLAQHVRCEYVRRLKSQY